MAFVICKLTGTWPKEKGPPGGTSKRNVANIINVNVPGPTEVAKLRAWLVDHMLQRNGNKTWGNYKNDDVPYFTFSDIQLLDQPSDFRTDLVKNFIGSKTSRVSHLLVHNVVTNTIIAYSNVASCTGLVTML